MSFSSGLTEKENSHSININSIKKNKNPKKSHLNAKLEDNYYENLFKKEMEFNIHPKKENIPNIIREYCKAIEYFSSIGDDKKSQQYKVLIDLFLNNPLTINLLEGNENNNENDINLSLMKSILISNKNREIHQILEEDNIRSGSEQLKNTIHEEEYKKYNKLINKNEEENKNRISINLVNEEIENQHSNFQKNLIMKKNTIYKKEKIINENKLIQSIQNAFINVENKNMEEKSNNSINSK